MLTLVNVLIIWQDICSHSLDLTQCLLWLDQCFVFPSKVIPNVPHFIERIILINQFMKYLKQIHFVNMNLAESIYLQHLTLSNAVCCLYPSEIGTRIHLKNRVKVVLLCQSDTLSKWSLIYGTHTNMIGSRQIRSGPNKYSVYCLGTPSTIGISNVFFW